jgi:hypothetical protein
MKKPFPPTLSSSVHGLSEEFDMSRPWKRIIASFPFPPKTKVKNKESLPDYRETKRATVVISQFFMGRRKKKTEKKENRKPIQTRDRTRDGLLCPHLDETKGTGKTSN